MLIRHRPRFGVASFMGGPREPRNGSDFHGHRLWQHGALGLIGKIGGATTSATARPCRRAQWQGPGFVGTNYSQVFTRAQLFLGLMTSPLGLRQQWFILSTII